eukprot:3891284-Rhodomonas_salina.2
MEGWMDEGREGGKKGGRGEGRQKGGERGRRDPSVRCNESAQESLNRQRDVRGRARSQQNEKEEEKRRLRSE